MPMAPLTDFDEPSPANFVRLVLDTCLHEIIVEKNLSFPVDSFVVCPVCAEGRRVTARLSPRGEKHMSNSPGNLNPNSHALYHMMVGAIPEPAAPLTDAQRQQHRRALREYIMTALREAELAVIFMKIALSKFDDLEAEEETRG